MDLLPIAGGSGTRLWPLSRELYPKQLLPLVGKGTMLQETLARVSGLEGVADAVRCEPDRGRTAERSDPVGLPSVASRL